MQPTPEGTRRQILEAALETLKEEGFAAATSRAVAARGGFNQALVFYYFGSMDALLLAALDWTSEQRLDAYRTTLADARSIDELLAAAGRLYREDRESGHISVVSQMIAGSIVRPELAPEMVVRMQPWIDLTEQVLERVIPSIGLPSSISTPTLAYAVATFYLGANLLTHLDPDRPRTDALIAGLAELETSVAALLERR
jgi:AcrR family transcriptional regulator